ncbi:MAG: 16S rRNA (guanine(966)-N(2))-methyltransferase RsmD [bacterium]|nr:16S rRNA (guanine(966)-N(2))-methyltransferase RsmD [bacterium]
MRIISGKYKGLKLCFPDNKKFRPTQDRVKESLFNIISKYVDQSHLLDLCCGTGSIGIEALSRGAEFVTFVDTKTHYVKRNLDLIPDFADGRCFKVVRSTAKQFLKKCDRSFNIIFIDPPWKDSYIYRDSLKAIYEFGILEPQGIIVCEHNKMYSLENTDGFEVFSSSRYGDAVLTLLKRTTDTI